MFEENKARVRRSDQSRGGQDTETGSGQSVGVKEVMEPVGEREEDAEDSIAPPPLLRRSPLPR